MRVSQIFVPVQIRVTRNAKHTPVSIFLLCERGGGGGEGEGERKEREEGRGGRGGERKREDERDRIDEILSDLLYEPEELNDGKM